ncbi:uncharacterized protein LOC133925451 [Phragmites australis]|uniref:uncharacterized protein LOC133925451 n=1 Tax=Phragmites australis TaxID=29695 RepID=UPI002D79273C|nr:uncharacterized protein LOC133925451 [Phragmites australis]
MPPTSSPSASSTTSSPSSDSQVPQAVLPPDVSIIQIVNICTHVLVTLDLTEFNYTQWHIIFESVFRKFGLATISHEILNIILQPKLMALKIWTRIEGLFLDNQLNRTVYLEAAYQNLYQGELTITQYCSKLKMLADSLRDVGHPISQPSQILNMFRILYSKYRFTVTVLSSKTPFPTFMETRS